MKHQRRLLAAILLLAGAAPLAAEPVIRRGIDVFTTTADEKTFYDFVQTPIPAGFFCEGSTAFAGRVALKGLPLETQVPGQLRGADTVIERLDDAVFAADGAAATRIRFRALSLVSLKPIQTSCGAFHVYVSLADKQRVTTMRINRTEEGGGNFVAPLAVNARMAFIPAETAKAAGARKLELTGSFTFPGTPIPWSLAGGVGAKRIGSVLLDTNGDLVPDTPLAGTSNFFPGWSPDGRESRVKVGSCTVCEPPGAIPIPPPGNSTARGA